MTKQELAEELGVPTSYIDSWIAEGLPFENDSIDFDVASNWLIGKGYGEEPEREVYTRGELGGVLGVSHVTVDTYKASPDFPPGPPWKVSQVIKWQLAQSAGKTKKSSSASDELATVKLEMARLKLDRERGEVIDVETVIEEMTRNHALARQKFRKLVPMLLELLPADTDARIVADYRQRAGQIISDAFEDIANAFRGEAE